MRSPLPLALVLLAAPGCGGDGEVPPMDDPRTLPDLEYCDPVQQWTPDHAAVEAAVLARIEHHRGRGADCGERGTFPPAPQLLERGEARCAARVHALDMLVREFVDHENPDGELVADRLAHAGWQGANTAEVIAAGAIAPGRMVDDVWMSTEGSCATLMDDTVTAVGVGVASVLPDPTDGETDDQYASFWVVVLTR